jgi:hypothetical protein
MDPYLEAQWRDIHARLMVYASGQINAQLPPGLRARVEEALRVSDASDADSIVYPDAVVLEDRHREPEVHRRDSTVEIAVPCVLILEDPPAERHIEIIDVNDDGHVITAIEVLSRSNKVGRAAVRTYRRKQQAYLDAGINLVEIDLLREGDFVLAAPEAQIPEEFRTQYRICTRRAIDPHRIELYRAPLRERLPNIPIPLRPEDDDIVLQLQPLIDECYREGRYDSLSYQQEPRPALAPEDALWADSLLKSAGRRQR